MSPEEPFQQQSQASEAQDPTQPSPLRKPLRRPQREQKKALAWIFPLLGCLFLLTGGSILLWQYASHPGTPGPAVQTPQALGACGSRLPFDWISQQLPPHLHLTVAQVTSQVRAGKTVQAIATEQGISAPQLYSIETQIMQDANTRWVNQGCISQQIAQENMQRFQALTQAEVNENFTDFYKR